jgi:hypothetical protein
MLCTSHDEGSLAGGDVVWRDLTGREPDELPWAHV